jgi:ethanolamine ammonia-lyase small subunit
MAYKPKPGNSDANRNLISNIHARGVSVDQAARRISNLAAMMIERQLSGVELKEIGSSGRRVTGSSENLPEHTTE